MLVIVDWVKHYESAASRVVGKLSWVRVPNTHDSQGFRRLMAHPDSVTLFGAFVLIVQVASKCAIRGVLANSDGEPLDILDIAAQCRGEAGALQRAIEVCSSERIGWIRDCPHMAAAMIASGRDPGGAAEAARTRRDQPFKEPDYQQTAPRYEREAEKYQPETTEERRGEEKRASERRLPEPDPRPPDRVRAAIWEAMAQRFPEVDETFAERVHGLILDGIRKGGRPPDLLDEPAARAIIAAATKPRAKSQGMYLASVPDAVRAWLRTLRIPDPAPSPDCPECSDRGYIGVPCALPAELRRAIEKSKARLCTCVGSARARDWINVEGDL